MGRFKVVEKFISINGEGRKAGELSCFIRFAGCNLNCSYCDTKWANEKNAPYEILSEEEIYGYIKDSGIINVTLTGGEPLIQPDIKRLLKLLSKDGSLNIEIETNGAVDIEDFKGIGDNISFTLDYKLAGSGMEEYMCHKNYELADNNDTVKFVVSDYADLDRMKRIVSSYKLLDRTNVYISACFTAIEPCSVVEYMIENNLNKARFQLQMHKYIWDPNRKGV